MADHAIGYAQVGLLSIQPGRTLAKVMPDGTVTIDWGMVAAAVADPHSHDRAWAKLLLCASDPATCSEVYEP